MISKKRIFLIYFAICLCAVFGVSRLYFYLTDDFRLSNISNATPFQEAWEVPPLKNEQRQQLDQILSHPFTYAGKGSQSYVFKSQDGKYILKFFKFKHLRPSWLIHFLPTISPLNEWKENEIKRKELLLNRIFDGYHLAYTEHQKQSALIYLHLNVDTSSNLPPVQVWDKLGVKQSIDLNTVPFILQKYVRTTREVLKEAIEKGNLPLAKIYIRKIIDLYTDEYSKGMYDADHGLKTNTGFVQNEPVRLDVGKLTKDERMKLSNVHDQDLKQVLQKFTGWLQRTYPPQIYEELTADIQLKINECCEHPFQLKK